MIVTSFPEQTLISRLKNQVTSRDTSSVEWPSVIVLTEVEKFFKHTPESSFAVLSHRKGRVDLNIDKRKICIEEETFFLVNPYQSFDYTVCADMPVATTNVHLNFTEYNATLHSLLNSDERLLEYPTELICQENIFYNQLYLKDAGFQNILSTYHHGEREYFYLRILEYLLQKEASRVRAISTISKKPSTREELYKRVAAARDYIYSYSGKEELSMEEVSAQVAMSHFHFLRVFKQVFGKSPYQVLKQFRMSKAQRLLETTDLPISEIAFQVGYKEPNAIYPDLKKMISSSPQKHRKEKLAILNS